MYYAEIALADGALFDTDSAPRCEYRIAQFDGGTQEGRIIQCRSTATMWTDRGLRCEAHGRE